MQASFTEQSYLTVRDVCEMLQLHRSTILRKVKQGNFPAPTKLGKAARWRFGDLQAFLAQTEQGVN